MHTTRRYVWLVLLSTVVVNGVLLTTLGCYFFTDKAFYAWPLIVIAEFVLSFRGVTSDADPTVRGIAIGCGVCLLLLPLWLELCLLVSSGL